MPITKKDILEKLPYFSKAPEKLLEDMSVFFHEKTFERGDMVLTRSDECSFLPLVTFGDIRIFLTGENGKEITLYHIQPGESCALTANCIFLGTPFAVFARAEERTDVFLVPAAKVLSWIHDFPIWQEYMLKISSQRIIHLIASISEVMFNSMDKRIVDFLLQNMDNHHTVYITHQEMAHQLGTAREVISRILKNFERKNILTLSRGQIEIKNLENLKKFQV